MLFLKKLFIALLLVITVVGVKGAHLYGLKSAIIRYDVSTLGIKTIVTQYIDDYGEKEVSFSTIETAWGKIKFNTLHLGDTTYVINLTHRVGQKVVGPEDVVNYLMLTPRIKEMRNVIEMPDNDVVVGKICTQYTMRTVQLEQTVQTDAWVWNGIVLKSEMKIGESKISQQLAVEIQENVVIDSTIFTVPKGIDMNSQENFGLEWLEEKRYEVIDIFGSPAKIDNTYLSFTECRSRNSRSTLMFNSTDYISDRDINLIDENGYIVKIDNTTIWNSTISGPALYKIQCETELIDSVRIVEIRRNNTIYRININDSCKKKKQRKTY